MRWKYDTKKVDGKHYVTQIRLDSETSAPDFILMIPDPGPIELIDDNGGYQYVVEQNPDYEADEATTSGNRPYRIVLSPQQLTIEEEAQKEAYAIRDKINELVTPGDVLKLLIAFKNGDSHALDEIEATLTEVVGPL